MRKPRHQAHFCTKNIIQDSFHYPENISNTSHSPPDTHTKGKKKKEKLKKRKKVRKDEKLTTLVCDMKLFQGKLEFPGYWYDRDRV
uniref:Uncharacterized protein n=1 Tax=Nelumbo nucifera TaxID=4432 RepID=A0A822Y4Q9_NELNU|nr:TPA_asm: hypothetical protein HUJ06_026051 [Nelumbo nucifera]